MDAIATQIRDLVSQADAAERSKILSALNELNIALQDPMDFLYGMYCSTVQIAAAKIGVDLGLFRKLVILQPGSSKTVTQLAQETGADAELLTRILRFLASVKFINEDGPDTYSASRLTHLLAHQQIEASITHGVGIMNPVANATPAFLAETGYKNITDTNNTPFQKAFNTDLKAFEWLQQHPDLFGALQVVMTSLESSNWTEGFDLFENEIQSLPIVTVQDKPPFFVDVGGGHGHQCVQLLKKYPNLHGRLVLEDLPEAVDKAQRTEGITYLAQDFFESQAVHGAKFYYMRRVMHDWPDDDCVKILRRLVDALGDESKILLDEVVLPDTGAHWQATMADISMMISFAGAERSSRKWHDIAEKAGLKIVHVHVYDQRPGYAITVLEKAS